jgi:hypothetical protein
MIEELNARGGEADMSYVANDTQQLALNDRYNNLTPREKKMIEESWAKAFSEIIFPAINEERFSVLYSDNPASRPNTPVNVTVGSMMLKEMLEQTDDGMVTGIIFDIRLQYALHTTSFAEQPLSDRTFSRFRSKLYEYEKETGRDLMKEEMLELSGKIAEFMEIKPHMKRMDSFMIASACKDMTRLEVVYTTTANLVKAVHGAHGEELLAGLGNYLKSDDKNRVIYHNKTEERSVKIQSIIEDCAMLVERLGDSGAGLPEYELAVRMLGDQSITDETGKRIAKDNREIKPNSLQNPSDPEATYRKKAGENHIGYVANVVETFNEAGASVITDYNFQQNRHSDSEFCEEAIKNIADKSETSVDEKVILIADGAYGSVVNSALAQENNITLVTTAMTGAKPPEVFADFMIDGENNRVLQCPVGNEPLKQGHNQATDTYRIVMEKSQCANCPHKGECKAKMQAKSAVVNVSSSKVKRARTIRNSDVSSEEYAKLRNARNGVEAIPSLMRRKYNVDDMPVYGLLKSKLLFGLKVGALNIKKLITFAKERAAAVPLVPCQREQYAQM